MLADHRNFETNVNRKTPKQPEMYVVIISIGHKHLFSVSYGCCWSPATSFRLRSLPNPPHINFFLFSLQH